MSGAWPSALLAGRAGRRALGILFGLGLVGLQARYFLIGCREAVLYRDEANDLFTAWLSWPELARQFVTDWDPYTFILGLRAWTAVWGNSEVSVRAMSLASMVLATLLFWRAARKWFGAPLPACAAALLLGTGYPMLTFGIGYARPYAFALLAVTWTFERLVALMERRSRGRYVLFAVAALLMGNVQPVTFGLLPAFSLIWMVHSWGGGGAWWPRLRRVLAVPCLLALTALPNLVQALRFISVDTGIGAAPAASMSPAFWGKQAMVFVGAVTPLGQELVSFALDDALFGAGLRLAVAHMPWVLLALLGLLTGVVCLRWWAAQPKGDARRKLAYTVLLFLVPWLYLSTAGFFYARMITPVRIYAAMAPGVVLGVVSVVYRVRPMLYLLLVLVFSRAVMGLAFFDARGTGKRSDARDACAYIQPRATTNDLIVLSNPAIGPTFSYYYHGPGRQIHHPYSHPVHYWNDVALWRHEGEVWRVDRTVGAVREAGKEGRRVWFIHGGTYLPEDPARWERFYCPEAYRASLDALDHGFVLIGRKSFETTDEPFYVSLYGPNAH